MIQYLPTLLSCVCACVFTVLLNGTIIIKRFRKFYCFLIFGTILLILFIPDCPLLSRISETTPSFSYQTSHTCGPLPLDVHLIFFEPIWITILYLEPNLDFQIFLNFSKTNHRIFNCDISNHRSVQVLPFIFFELRALTLS